MKGRMIVLDHLGEVEAAALLVEGKLHDILIDHADAPRPGAIYRAICDRPIKGQGGMMLRLPEGGTAFLRAAKGKAPGQALLVQVTGYAEDRKAVPVTQKVLFKSRYAIVTPGAPGLNISRSIKDEDTRDELLAIAHAADLPEGYGLILRSSCAGADPVEIAEDIDAMAAMADTVMAETDGKTAEALTEGDSPHALAWREWVDPAQVITDAGGFAREGVLDQLAALGGFHKLGEGGMYVEPTRALVAVDVNTGNDTSPAAALKVNLAAARALPLALRLRGLAGQIAVDFAPMSKAHRKQIEQALRAAFRGDPVDTALVGWTPLGHFELQRKRERLPLAPVLGALIS
ncbi:ribonuclease E/G [Octadecabacter sp. R77987]|uniref:ribonuclease E/G n=1 Tax=Octadecabacter sp. R77987 TaxID=3093874 RepID=UPI00366D9DEC